MDMRYKRNQRNVIISTDGYIKKYFGNEIKRILVPSNRSIQNSDMPYVPHIQGEHILGDYLNNDEFMDQQFVFTGLTGTGKTTILRHVFQLEGNGNKPRIDEGRVIIPIDFNRSQSSADAAIHSNLRVAVDMLCNEKKIDYPDVENNSFYSYIENRRPDLLRINTRQTIHTSYTDKMNYLLEKMPVVYASCQLQYVMDHPNCDIKLVILIIDNIEAFILPGAKDSRARYLSPVIEAFKLAECISQRDNPTDWYCNLLIVCRHHVWRIMTGEFLDDGPENTLLQSYVANGIPYDLADPVKVDAIVNKRNEVFSRKQRDPEKWNKAVEIVDIILQTMEKSIGDFVLQLELKDLRKSMLKLQELIFHNGLQKKSDAEIESGAFQIDSVEQFDLNRVNLIRIIGLGKHKYYSGASSLIPNLLYNEHNSGIELYLLLTLKYFLIKCEYAEPAWDNPVSISDFYMNVNMVFEIDEVALHKLFGRSIQKLIQQRMLLRSADQSQDDVPGLSLEDISRIEHVYVSGAAVKLWEELGKSSALFQLYLDDIWFDEQYDFKGDDGNDVEHCVKYLGVLVETEKRIFSQAKNLTKSNVENYIQCFGEVPVCKHLVDGLLASLKAIIQSGDSKTHNRIKTAKETEKKAKGINASLIDWQNTRLD